MTINRLIGVLFIGAGIGCFWMESADKSTADWKIDVLGIALALVGIWIGKFRFKRSSESANK